jgi:hypothetical protein
MFLVVTFILAIALLFLKGLVTEERSVAAINGLNLWLLLFQIAVTWDVFSSVLMNGADITRARAGDAEAKGPVSKGSD